MKMNICTDGACSGNPGPGGWGAVVFNENGDAWELSGFEPDTTNNRMELTAVIHALEFAREKAGNAELHVTLTTDSQYIVNAVNQKWLTGWQKNGWRTSAKKPVLNQDLWQQFLDCAKNMTSAEFMWVKGHAGHPENERCDRLAVAAIENAAGVMNTVSDAAITETAKTAETGETDYINISDLSIEAKKLVLDLVNQLRSLPKAAQLIKK
ncbi:hypothetical protein AGMMS49975_23880 [Clostridia bacterium]|nr:hypothetical protein AGMMS49975_23880 [Clostridia bacterium]